MQTKETYVHTKETYMHTKETYMQTKETYRHTKETHWLQKPLMHTRDAAQSHSSTHTCPILYWCNTTASRSYVSTSPASTSSASPPPLSPPTTPVSCSCPTSASCSVSRFIGRWCLALVGTTSVLSTCAQNSGPGSAAILLPTAVACVDFAAACGRATCKIAMIVKSMDK